MKNKINTTNIYDTVRYNIRKYRRLKGMTQQELADASDLSHGYIRINKEKTKTEEKQIKEEKVKKEKVVKQKNISPLKIE